MKELTKAEEQLMKYLWKLERAFLKDIVDQYPEPRPAYTTISTVVNVLVRKKMVDFKTYGKSREYFAVLSRQQYLKQSFKGLLSGFFEGSPKQFASFFTSDQDLSISELEEIRSLIEEEINKQKGKA